MRVSGFLYGVGAFAVVAGAVMVGYGIPINEFSFGNTLIAAGVTAAVGGLIVIALGVVVAQLQQLNDALAGRAPVRQSRPFDTFDTAAARNAPASGRIPFPPRPKADAELREPPAFEPHMDVASPPDLPAEEPQPAPSFAPMLRNPEEPPVMVEVEVSLSPPHPMAAAARGPGAAPPQVEDETTPDEDYYEPKRDDDWRPPPPPVPPTRQPSGNYFDSMWPAEPKSAEPKLGKTPADTDTKPMTEPAAPPERRDELPAPIEERPDSEQPRGVPILKSGVVDGMGYTLYVDGSIEAELPQGTLRFSSINELRSHLEKNS